jgi:hypothetical protein
VTVSLLTVTYTWSEPLVKGFLFRQGVRNAKVDAVRRLAPGGTSYEITLQKNLSGIVNGAGTLTVGIPSEIEWVPQDAGSPATKKQFPYCQLYLEKDFILTSRFGFFADTQLGREFTKDIPTKRTRGWGSSPWGSSPWGDGQEGTSTPIRTRIPRAHQRCRTLRVIWQHVYAKEGFDILHMALDARPYTTRTQREPR